MNKKLLLGMLSIALVLVVGIPALMSTWNSCTITMHASSGSNTCIGQFADCLCTIPVTSHDWGLLSQDQEYEMPLYVKNTGNEAVELYFYAYPTSANAWIPTIFGGVYPGDCTIYFNNQQVQFYFEMTAITHEGLPCQLDDVNYDPGYGCVPCKFIQSSDLHDGIIQDEGDAIIYDGNQGYIINPYPSPMILNPGKVQKFDVKLTVGSLVAGATYDFTFTIEGKTVTGTNGGMT